MSRNTRIALVHSFYRSENPSGENNTVLRQLDLLQASGFTVELFSVKTDELIQSNKYQVRTALNYSLGRGVELDSAIDSFKPSLIHVHNLFPNISETAISRSRVPYVMTIHNYRYLCANGIFFRDDHPCFDCIGSHGFASVVHGCYKESRVATIPLSLRLIRDTPQRPIIKNAARLIFPSEYSLKTFWQAGKQVNSVVIHQPGPALSEPAPLIDRGNSGAWIFIGRLTEEKGVRLLIESWPRGRKLLLAGGGPLDHEVRAIAASRNLDVEFLGSISHEKVLDYLALSSGLVFTSLWPEVAPLVYAEALALGKPVISYGNNTVSDWVSEHNTGYVLSLADARSWNDAIEYVSSNSIGIASKARFYSESTFSEGHWIASIRSLYNDVLER